jgi:hypothetical protein
LNLHGSKGPLFRELRMWVPTSARYRKDWRHLYWAGRRGIDLLKIGSRRLNLRGIDLLKIGSRRLNQPPQCRLNFA